ncbi:MAG: hypothetical protein HY822_17185 [Acidobacteria bacterium]|nr:hypothetical protein [Acidobacteriota bacterium]
MTSTRRTFLYSGAAAFAAPRRAGSIVKTADPRTGHEVWQITSGEAPSQACYFEAQAFTGDDRYLVYESRQSGAWQLQRMDLASGESSQITRACATEPGATCCSARPTRTW